jgi:subtilisin family serine protease
MDVKRLLGWLSLVLIVSACDQKKTSQKVFPENYQKPNQEVACDQAAFSKIPTRFLVAWEDGHITVETSENSDLFVRDFMEPQLRDIKHVEFDRWIHLDTQVVQAAASADNSWGQHSIQLDSVHAEGVKGQGVTVAIVDTPVDYSHPQLQRRMVEGWDFVSNTAHASLPHEHATHIAGVIAAEEGGPVDGLAPQAQVMGVSFMDASGSGSLGDAIKAMNYAADHGARVINNSWGGPLCSETMRLATRALSDRGVLLMVAAGNDGVDILRSPTYPASFTNPLQITIGASQVSEIMSGFSNTSWTLVHLVAPGQDIYSTVPGGYTLMSGTSMATPFVTGAAALLLSAKPNASPALIKQAILASVDPGPFRVLTQGRLNVQRALAEIRRLVP